jgi:hypothetical protein
MGTTIVSVDAPERGSYTFTVSGFVDTAGVAITAMPDANWTLTNSAGSVVNSRDAVAFTFASVVYIALSGLDLAGSGNDWARVLTIKGTYTDTRFGAGASYNEEIKFNINPQVVAADVAESVVLAGSSLTAEITAARDGYDTLLLKQDAQDTATATAQTAADDAQTDATQAIADAATAQSAADDAQADVDTAADNESSLHARISLAEVGINAARYPYSMSTAKTGAQNLTALQAAIDAAIALGGRRVYIPAGTYPLAPGADWTAGNNQQIWIEGDGYSTVLQASSAGTLLSVNPGGSNYQELRLQNLRFNPNNLDVVCVHVAQNGQQGILENIYINGNANVTGGLIQLGTAASSGPTVLRLKNIKIRGNSAAVGVKILEDPNSLFFDECEIVGCTTGIGNETVNAIGGSYMAIMACRIDDNTNGIALKNTSLLGLTVAGGCRFEANTGYAIDLQGFDATNNRMRGVYIAGNYFTGLEAGRVGIRAQRIEGLTIVGNLFKASNGLGAYPAGVGLELVSAITRASLVGNATPSNTAVGANMTGYSVAFAVDNLFADQHSKDSPLVSRSIQHAVLTAEPTDKANGMIVYADGTSWNPGSGAGFYGYEGGAWVKL